MYTSSLSKMQLMVSGGSTSKIEFYFGPNMFFSVESPENVYGGSLQPHNYTSIMKCLDMVLRSVLTT